METPINKVRIVVDDMPEIAEELDRLAEEKGLNRASFLRMIFRMTIREAAEQKPTETVPV
jgi:hypothetical protein